MSSKKPRKSAENIRFSGLFSFVLRIEKSHVFPYNHGMTNPQNNVTNGINLLSREELEKQNRILSQQLAETKAKLNWYEEQYRLSKEKQFGRSSEKDLAGQMNLSDVFPLFNEAETFREMINTEPKEEDLPSEQDSDEGKRKRRKKDTKNLTVVIDTYELPIEDQICPKCGAPLHVMKEKVRTEIEVIPAKVVAHKYVTYVYACRNCEKNGDTTIITAPGARTPMIEKSMASPSLMADAITKKYMDALPFYRQERSYKHYGIKITRNNLCNWSITVANNYFKLITERMKKILFDEHVIHCDETEVEVLCEPDRPAHVKSRVWVLTSGEYLKDKNISLYRYTEGRARIDAEAVLKGYTGYIMCDGYQVYDAITKPKGDKPAMDVKPVACLVHVRRKFADALKLLAPEDRPGTGAQEALDRLAAIFNKDNSLNDLSPEERKEKRIHGDTNLPSDKRGKSLYDLIDDFFVWVKSEYDEALHQTHYGTALKYAIDEEEKVRRVFEDGRLELDNNLAERAVKPFVIGRKNWLFSNTPAGADASCILYSIVQSAMNNGLIPFEYIKYLLEEMPGKALTDEYLDTLLPWSKELPEYIKVPSDN